MNAVSATAPPANAAQSSLGQRQKSQQHSKEDAPNPSLSRHTSITHSERIDDTVPIISAVPHAYKRVPFHPAQQALAILELPASRRAATVAHLKHLRDGLVQTVAQDAPPWPNLVELAATLTETLQVSHHASRVTAQISELAAASKNANGRVMSYSKANFSTNASTTAPTSINNDINSMVGVLQKLENAQAKVKLLANVRELVVLVDASEKTDERVEKIALISKAIAAANSPPLSHVRALAPCREGLEKAARALHNQLTTEIARGIFHHIGPNHPPHHMQQYHRSGQPSKPAPIPVKQKYILQNLVDSSSAAADASLTNETTSYAQAREAILQLDALRGPTASSRAIQGIADEQLDSLIIGILKAAALPEARFAYAAANRQNDLDTDRFRRSELGAHSRLGRPVCAKVFQDLDECLRGIMDRLVRLSIDVPEMKGQEQATATVWNLIEARVTAMARYMLDICEDDSLLSRNTIKQTSYHNIALSIKLVPDYDNRDMAIDRLPFSWRDLVVSLPDVMPDIYNLAAIHCCMLRIASHGADAVSGLSERDDVIRFLENAGKVLIETVDRDIGQAVMPVLALRSTALMQAATFRDRVTVQHHAGAQQLKLNLLPTVRDIAPVVADVLSLAALVPTVSSDLGSILSERIFVPLETRCTAALNLASTWSEAGNVYDRVVVDNPTMDARDVINREASHECKPTLDAVIALFGDEAVSNLAEPLLFEEVQWKSVVQLAASVAALVYEVRRCAGEDLNGLAADVIPLVRFRPRIRSSYAASSAGTPLSTSSLGSFSGLRLGDISNDATRKDSELSLRPQRGGLLQSTSDGIENADHITRRTESESRAIAPVRGSRLYSRGNNPNNARAVDDVPPGKFGGRARVTSNFQPQWSSTTSIQSPGDTGTYRPNVLQNGDTMRAIARAVSAAQTSICRLEVTVVDRAILLLHADTMTRCYVQALRAVRNAVLSVDNFDDETGQNISETCGGDKSATVDSRGSAHRHEYDEYGDPIDDSDEDYVNSSGNIEQSVASSSSGSSYQQNVGSGAGSGVDSTRNVEAEPLAAGLQLGTELRWAYGWSKVGLGPSRRRFVFDSSGAAISVGLKSGYCRHGRTRSTGSLAAKAFLRGVRAEGGSALRNESRRSTGGGANKRNESSLRVTRTSETPH